MLVKLVKLLIGGSGKLERVPLICIITGGYGGYALLSEIYEHVKHDIPKVFKKSYEYLGRGQLNLPLPEDSTSYRYVMDLAEKCHLNPTVFQTVHYTKTEEERAEYFEMRIHSPLQLEGTDAGDYGTQYSGGCPYCGLGGKPIGDVFVDRKFIKKYSIGTLYPDIFVTEPIKNLILENNLTGVSFECEVKDYKGREMPKNFVMNIHNVLPTMSDCAWLIKNPHIDKRYEKCGHQVVYHRSDAQYEREKLSAALDFNLSHEYVDNFRLQVIIVSARVRNLFKKNKIQAVFFPVTIL